MHLKLLQRELASRQVRLTDLDRLGLAWHLLRAILQIIGAVPCRLMKPMARPPPANPANQRFLLTNSNPIPPHYANPDALCVADPQHAAGREAGCSGALQARPDSRGAGIGGCVVVEGGCEGRGGLGAEKRACRRVWRPLPAHQALAMTSRPDLLIRRRPAADRNRPAPTSQRPGLPPPAKGPALAATRPQTKGNPPPKRSC
jgi:hypothetical protein